MGGGGGGGGIIIEFRLIFRMERRVCVMFFVSFFLLCLSFVLVFVFLFWGGGGGDYLQGLGRSMQSI